MSVLSDLGTSIIEPVVVISDAKVMVGETPTSPHIVRNSVFVGRCVCGPPSPTSFAYVCVCLFFCFWFIFSVSVRVTLDSEYIFIFLFYFIEPRKKN
jgi:hypothetical protein